jgi:hypothetical protein
MLLNSPVTAIAAVAIPSMKAPATADVMYALTMVYLLRGLWGFLPPILYTRLRLRLGAFAI